MQRNRADRYQDVVDFITDLSKYINTREGSEKRMSGDALERIVGKSSSSAIDLSPLLISQWPGIEVGLALHHGVGIGGLYYDFFELANGNHAIVLAEPMAKGVEGLIHTASLAGMIRCLSHLTSDPSHLITVLNDLITRDAPHQIFTLSLLVIAKDLATLKFLSCGEVYLWQIGDESISPRRIKSGNPALGLHPFEQFKELTLHGRRVIRSFFIPSRPTRLVMPWPVPLRRRILWKSTDSFLGAASPTASRDPIT